MERGFAHCALGWGIWIFYLLICPVGVLPQRDKLLLSELSGSLKQILPLHQAQRIVKDIQFEQNSNLILLSALVLSQTFSISFCQVLFFSFEGSTNNFFFPELKLKLSPPKLNGVFLPAQLQHSFYELFDSLLDVIFIFLSILS